MKKKACPANCGIDNHNIQGLMVHWFLVHHDGFVMAMDILRQKGLIK